MATFDDMNMVTFTAINPVERKSTQYIGTIAAVADSKKAKSLLVNAAVMRHGEEENNKPWVVDILL